MKVLNPVDSWLYPSSLEDGSGGVGRVQGHGWENSGYGDVWGWAATLKEVSTFAFVCLSRPRPMEMLDFLIRYDEKGRREPIMSSSPRPPSACMRRSFMACYPATDSNQVSERGQNVGLPLAWQRTLVCSFLCGHEDGPGLRGTGWGHVETLESIIRPRGLRYCSG